MGLRVQSAARTVDVGFDGYAVGGLSVGESRDEMLPALATTVEHLPADQPRYFMGLGDPAGLVEAVALGVDLFDCVLPTRHARHGTVLTSAGRLSIRAKRFERDEGPLDPTCECVVCARWSRLLAPPPSPGRTHRGPAHHHPQRGLAEWAGQRASFGDHRASLRTGPTGDPRRLGVTTPGETRTHDYRAEKVLI